MDRHWLLTSAFYGNWLPGDPRGFVSRVRDEREDDPSREARLEHDIPGTPYDQDYLGLYRSAQEAMTGPPVKVTLEQAETLRDQFEETARHRGWRILAGSVMDNHIHLVVGAPGDPSPTKILGDFKGWGSRPLNERWGVPASGTWWTSKGSKRILRDEAAVKAAVRYVLRQKGALCVWSGASADGASGVASAPRVERQRISSSASGAASAPRVDSVSASLTESESSATAGAADAPLGALTQPRSPETKAADAPLGALTQPRSPGRFRLLTPGPTPVPEEILRELARPAYYHRSPTYRRLLTEVTAGLQYVFRTRHPVLTITASGTGGMEAALASSLPPGAKAICLISGRWGERWRNIARALGIEAVSVTSEPGAPVSPGQLADALAKHPDAAAVCSTLSETATGVKNDIEAFGRITAGTDALLLVDAISGLGCVPCHVDDWNVDLCVTGSQKALMLPPGLAFVSASPKAWARIDANPNPRSFYFDLRKYRDTLPTGDSPFTPATYLVRALAKALERIRAEGLEAIWERAERLGLAARAGMLAMNLRLFASVPAEGLTVAHVPAGIDGNALISELEARHGVKLAGGQDALKGKIIRLAHMGDIDAFDVLAALSALELTLAAMGHALTPGAGVAAAQRSLASSGN